LYRNQQFTILQKISEIISDHLIIEIQNNGKGFSNYLEDFEEFELSSSDIDDLDGVQFCIHAKSINVSNNRIFDLSYLSDLTQLEE
jgi:hypothetical protein